MDGRISSLENFTVLKLERQGGKGRCINDICKDVYVRVYMSWLNLEAALKKITDHT